RAAQGVCTTLQRPSAQVAAYPSKIGAHAGQPMGSLGHTRSDSAPLWLPLSATGWPLQPEQQAVPERKLQSLADLQAVISVFCKSTTTQRPGALSADSGGR